MKRIKNTTSSPLESADKKQIYTLITNKINYSFHTTFSPFLASFKKVIIKAQIYTYHQLYISPFLSIIIKENHGSSYTSARVSRFKQMDNIFLFHHQPKRIE